MSASRFSRGVAAVAKVVRAVVGAVRDDHPLLDYSAPYIGKVLKQHGSDMLVDVRLEAEGWPDLTRVPIRMPLPGVTFTVETDAPCIVEFAGGRPNGQFVSKVDSATALKTLHIDSGEDTVVNGGTQKVARVDDLGDAGTLTLRGDPGTDEYKITVTYTPPNGGLPTNVEFRMTADAMTGDTVQPTIIRLVNKNTEGAERFKA